MNSMPPESNMLLRSAYEIAKRHGANTNWEAFAASCRAELFEQAGLADLNDEQTVLRVTCTPRTYREYQPTEPSGGM